MLANYLIGLREGLEAGLVVGVLIAYVGKIGRRDVLPRLWFGIGLAVALSLAVGAILTWGPYGLSFQAQEILGGVLSILAVALVTWMIFWMSAHAAGISRELRSKVDAALAGSTTGIVAIGVVSVGREGIETALFVWANVSSSGDALLGTIGAVLGILTAIVIAYLIYRGLVRINLTRFFKWTGLFLILVAAGVLAYAVGELQEAGVLPGWGTAAFSLAAVASLSTWYGALLGGLFGYTPEPTWLQFGAWLGYLAIVTPLFLLHLRSRRSVAPRPVSSTESPPASSVDATDPARPASTTVPRSQ
ncbi:iron uptake transporter permease EfeU [Agromyces atrinae]|uniref:High-affinity Fe2+/Pb2+ permease n=1 Tax=Agromyces atrinae TaxID=592376 RepID=A0A4V1R231_9MICO|nr:iron uptake transporter permease EfeU [Agromyces atrinae]NYD65535.1 high-affinity iron transporter [Agromyces atrinae]RXZ85736.1 high-affinity Fe2+/Pb2+ permease [Agromyces atrinae]